MPRIVSLVEGLVSLGDCSRIARPSCGVEGNHVHLGIPFSVGCWSAQSVNMVVFELAIMAAAGWITKDQCAAAAAGPLQLALRELGIELPIESTKGDQEFKEWNFRGIELPISKAAAPQAKLAFLMAYQPVQCHHDLAQLLEHMAARPR